MLDSGAAQVAHRTRSFKLNHGKNRAGAADGAAHATNAGQEPPMAPAVRNARSSCHDPYAFPFQPLPFVRGRPVPERLRNGGSRQPRLPCGPGHRGCGGRTSGRGTATTVVAATAGGAVGGPVGASRGATGGETVEAVKKAKKDKKAEQQQDAAQAQAPVPAPPPPGAPTQTDDAPPSPPQQTQASPPVQPATQPAQT